MLEALGAEVVLVPQVDGAPGQVTGADVAAAAEVAQRLAAERGGFYVDQFNALEGPGAHEATTGPEIWLSRTLRGDERLSGMDKALNSEAEFGSSGFNYYV